MKDLSEGFYWLKNNEGEWFVAELSKIVVSPYPGTALAWQFIGLEESIPFDDIPEDSIGPKIENRPKK